MLKFMNMMACRRNGAGFLVYLCLGIMVSTTIRAQTNEIDVEVDLDAIYFHPAASHYIHGDTTSASNLVVKGLSIDPEDGKLLRLKELLEQQQEQQQNQDDQQNQDQQQQDDQQQDQNQDQQDEPQEQNPEEQEQEQDQQDQQAEPPSAEEMSADEAEQLLDAMKQEEQNKRLQLHPVMGAPVKVDKDW